MGAYRDASGSPPGVARLIETEMDEARRFLARAAEQVDKERVTVEIIIAMGDAPR